MMAAPSGGALSCSRQHAAARAREIRAAVLCVPCRPLAVVLLVLLVLAVLALALAPSMMSVGRAEAVACAGTAANACCTRGQHASSTTTAAGCVSCSASASSAALQRWFTGAARAPASQMASSASSIAHEPSAATTTTITAPRPHLPLVHDHRHVRVAHGGQAVRDDDDGAVARRHGRVQRALHLRLALRVLGGRKVRSKVWNKGAKVRGRERERQREACVLRVHGHVCLRTVQHCVCAPSGRATRPPSEGGHTGKHSLLH